MNKQKIISLVVFGIFVAVVAFYLFNPLGKTSKQIEQEISINPPITTESVAASKEDNLEPPDYDEVVEYITNHFYEGKVADGKQVIIFSGVSGADLEFTSLTYRGNSMDPDVSCEGAKIDRELNYIQVWRFEKSDGYSMDADFSHYKEYIVLDGVKYELTDVEKYAK